MNSHIFQIYQSCDSAPPDHHLQVLIPVDGMLMKSMRKREIQKRVLLMACKFTQTSSGCIFLVSTIWSLLTKQSSKVCLHSREASTFLFTSPFQLWLKVKWLKADKLVIITFNRSEVPLKKIYGWIQFCKMLWIGVGSEQECIPMYSFDTVQNSFISDQPSIIVAAVETYFFGWQLISSELVKYSYCTCFAFVPTLDSIDSMFTLIQLDLVILNHLIALIGFFVSFPQLLSGLVSEFIVIFILVSFFTIIFFSSFLQILSHSSIFVVSTFISFASISVFPSTAHLLQLQFFYDISVLLLSISVQIDPSHLILSVSHFIQFLNWLLFASLVLLMYPSLDFYQIPLQSLSLFLCSMVCFRVANFNEFAFLICPLIF